jgi:hypothetical protein
MEKTSCKGCKTYTNTISAETSLYCMHYMREDEQGIVIPRCPCMTCLIKGVCVDACPEYDKNFKLIMIRDYVRQGTKIDNV